jgi:hypothetical protein
MTKLPIIERGTALIIRTDGSEEILKGWDGWTLDMVRRAMLPEGEGSVEATTLGTTNDDLIMWGEDDIVDGEFVETAGGGYIRPTGYPRPINDKATAIYHAAGGNFAYEIPGDQLIVHASDFEQEEEGVNDADDV